MSNSSAVTLSTKSPIQNITFGELMEKQLRSLDLTKTLVGQQRENPPENVKKNTSREFKEAQVEFCAQVAKIYRTFYVTRQMVVAVNLLRGQSSCPNYINKNDYCLTGIRGLYVLPHWALPKDLVSEIRGEMKVRAEEYRKQKKAEALAKKEEEKKKAAEKKASEKKAAEEKANKETSKEDSKKTSKKGGKKTSKKKPEEVVAAGPVEPTTETPAETLAPPQDDAVNSTLAQVEAAAEEEPPTNEMVEEEPEEAEEEPEPTE